MIDTGRIQIYYGDGKGKTTAAVGLCMRAAAQGLNICYFQFLERDESSERAVLKQIPGITVLEGRVLEKKVRNLNRDEKAIVKRYNNKALDELAKFSTNFDLLVLDDALTAISLDLLSEEKIYHFLKGKARGLEVVLTGTDVTERILKLADYATYMKKISHPADQGKMLRRGIDY